jgi:hypothetical protein
VIADQQVADVLGVEALGARREPDQVDEDDGDGLSLLGQRPLGDRERARARVAKPGSDRIFVAAAGARGPGRKPTTLPVE